MMSPPEDILYFIDTKISHMLVRPKMYGEYIGVELAVLSLLDIRDSIINEKSLIFHKDYKSFLKTKFKNEYSDSGNLHPLGNMTMLDDNQKFSLLEEFLLSKNKFIKINFDVV